MNLTGNYQQIQKHLKVNLLTFSKEGLGHSLFLNYLNLNKKILKPNLLALVDFHYSNFLDAQLNQFYNENLENEFPEFAAVMEEYRDGLLLFDLMEKEIWEKSKTDTLGLKLFMKQLRKIPLEKPL
jgi:peptidyl-prolyl cis-trans isomerase SurA